MWFLGILLATTRGAREAVREPRRRRWPARHPSKPGSATDMSYASRHAAPPRALPPRVGLADLPRPPRPGRGPALPALRGDSPRRTARRATAGRAGTIG